MYICQVSQSDKHVIEWESETYENYSICLSAPVIVMKKVELNSPHSTIKMLVLQTSFLVTKRALTWSPLNLDICLLMAPSTFVTTPAPSISPSYLPAHLSSSTIKFLFTPLYWATLCTVFMAVASFPQPIKYFSNLLRLNNLNWITQSRSVSPCVKEVSPSLIGWFKAGWDGFVRHWESFMIIGERWKWHKDDKKFIELELKKEVIWEAQVLWMALIFQCRKQIYDLFWEPVSS